IAVIVISVVVGVNIVRKAVAVAAVDDHPIAVAKAVVMMAKKVVVAMVPAAAHAEVASAERIAGESMAAEGHTGSGVKGGATTERVAKARPDQAGAGETTRRCDDSTAAHRGDRAGTNCADATKGAATRNNHSTLSASAQRRPRRA